LCNRSGVDEPEAGRGLPCRIARLRGESIGRGRIRGFRAIEDVGPLGADVQVHPLFEPEDSAHSEVFDWTPLVSVIPVKSRRSTELAGSGIRPRLGIQDEGRVGIEAMAVQVLRKKWLPRHAICVGGSEQQVGKLILGRWSFDREAGSIRYQRCNRPISHCPGRGRAGKAAADLEFGNRIGPGNIKHVRLVERREILVLIPVEDVIERSISGAASGRVPVIAQRQIFLPGEDAGKRQAVREALRGLNHSSNTPLHSIVKV
jgi:hypothetical protein